MVLRIEDLDPRARNPEAARLLMDDLAWLGLTWDEGPYYQSERTDLYLEALEELRGSGLVYPCFCTRAQLHVATAPHASDGTFIYPGTCRNLTPEEVERKSRLRPPAIRLRVPEASDPAGTIHFTDRCYGPQAQVLARECGDFLVQRSDGVIAYQLAVVVDDAAMGVSEVVRGHDLLGSVGRQVYLQRLLGFREPDYGHVPLLMAEDGHRLSKRERDLDLGAIRNVIGSPEPLLGMLASFVGLAERGESTSADTLVDRFSWKALAKHGSDVVVPGDFVQKDPL